MGGLVWAAHFEKGIRVNSIDWHGLIPFVLATGQQQRISAQRIIESILIAGLTAGAVLYGQQMVFVEQVKDLRQDMQEVKGQLEKIHGDFYMPRLPKSGD